MSATKVTRTKGGVIPLISEQDQRKREEHKRLHR